MSLHTVSARHIQNFSDAESVEYHWGYAVRVLPCTSGKDTCEYLDLVYGAFDRGVLYTGIIWATILATLFIWCTSRHVLPSAAYWNGHGGVADAISRMKSSLKSASRQYLLPDAVHSIFGRTTRLQVLVLLTLTGYVTIFTFVGMTYQSWTVPVKKSPGAVKHYSTLGPWSDRIGLIAFALTPLSVLLATRESLLSLITGLPYQSFNFLHRWLGYIIFVQSSLHTIGWCIIEFRLYGPAPQHGLAWLTETYAIWGVVAMILLLLIFVGSTPWGIKMTGYEFFRKTHYVLAMLYIGACWGHWAQLYCWMIASLVVWFVDRAMRLIRSALLHYQYLGGSSSMGFVTAKAQVTLYADSINGNVVRLDFDHVQDPWHVGQHFYLTFPKSSIWQSHPFTPLSLPEVTRGTVRHSYVFRAKSGETRKIAQLATGSKQESLPVILTGPYGVSEVSQLHETTNILCIAGGTGITYVLPVLLQQLRKTPQTDKKLELIWVIRRKDDMEWIKDELHTLQSAGASHNITVRAFVTREAAHEKGEVAEISVSKEFNLNAKPANGCLCSGEPSSSSGSSLDEKEVSGPILVERRGSFGGTPAARRPDLRSLVQTFVNDTIRGDTTVYASGPGGMISDLRTIVASCNDGAKVWQGQERYDVRLCCDDRLER